MFDLKPASSIRISSRSAVMGWLVLVAATWASAQPREVAVARPQQQLNDLAGVVDQPTADRLERVLANLREQSEVNFVVVTIKTAGQDDLYTLSNALANEWTIGSPASADKSVLLFITTDNGKFFTFSSG